MPVLNYHRDVKDMPDMSKLQKCNTCGVDQIGNRMYYSYPQKTKIEVICRSCMAKVALQPPARNANRSAALAQGVEMSEDYELIGAIKTAKQIRRWAQAAIASNRDDVRLVIRGAMLEAAQLLSAVDPPSEPSQPSTCTYSSPMPEIVSTNSTGN